jgi:hypothetical protein
MSTAIVKTFPGKIYTVEVRSHAHGLRFDVRYFKEGWSALARTRGFIDYETHSEEAAIRKARAVHAELEKFS